MALEFPPFVHKNGIAITPIDAERQGIRYSLRIPFKKIDSENFTKRAIVILKNPSEAIINHEKKIYKSDPTVDRVIRYFNKKKYAEITVLNLFAMYGAYSEVLNDYVLDVSSMVGQFNDEHIRLILSEYDKSKDVIVVAWGGYPQKSTNDMKNIYDQRIKEMRTLIGERKVQYIGRCTDIVKKFPLHGMLWSYADKMKLYKWN